MTAGLSAFFTANGVNPTQPFGQVPLMHNTSTPAPASRSAVDSRDPAFRFAGHQEFAGQAAQAPSGPMAPVNHNPPTGSMGGVSATALIHALQQPTEEPVGPSLETLRMQMFGNYYTELEGKMGELRSSVDGTMAKGRRALMERMDELGAGLHRDMVAMRQEMQKELEDLKRDVFSAVMSISALNDKLGLTDSRFRETWMAVTKALTDRIDNQAVGLSTAMRGMESKMDQMVEERVDRLVETAMLRQVAIWKSRQATAAAEAA